MARGGRPRSGERREQILDVALRLFAEHGIQQVSTRRIAQAVGISQPSLYAHFRTSDEIAVELCCRGFTRLHDQLTGASAKAGTPEERLRRLGEEYVRFGLEHPAVYRVAFMLDQPTGHGDEPSPVLAAGLRAFGVLLALFQEVRDAHDDKTTALAQSTWASMHGLVALFLVRHEFPWVRRETLIALHLDRICTHAFEDARSTTNVRQNGYLS